MITAVSRRDARRPGVLNAATCTPKGAECCIQHPVDTSHGLARPDGRLAAGRPRAATDRSRRGSLRGIIGGLTEAGLSGTISSNRPLGRWTDGVRYRHWEEVSR